MQKRASNGEEPLVRIPAGQVALEGNLRIPEAARGVVVFAHGSGSSRFSPRNRFVADVLEQAGLATLLMDLLTPDEEAVDGLPRQPPFGLWPLAGRPVPPRHSVPKPPPPPHPPL